jgi:hemoglobin
MKNDTTYIGRATLLRRPNFSGHARQLCPAAHSFLLMLLSIALAATVGCGSTRDKKQNKEFFTSGSRDADQRASQRMAKAEQLERSGEGAGEKVKTSGEKDKVEDKAGASNKEIAPKKVTLYERLGSDEGIAKIVDDFTSRALQDPRVNWQRNGVRRGRFFGRNETVSWSANPSNVALLKKHLAQFFALATGGPAHYQGRDMKSAHASLHISNAEFDAAVGDLKASLDKLQVPNQEQKELLAIAESTRPQIVTER